MDLLRDLWPDLLNVTECRPLIILREQADFLRRKTNGRVEGRVRSFGTSRFRLSFSLAVPGEITDFELFRMSHAAANYPVTIDRSIVNSAGELKGESEFLKWLEDVFHSEITKRVIMTLLVPIERL